jgi:hypothetical protein
VNPANSLDPVNATFGTSGATTLDINLGNVAGNPTAAPLNVTGTLTVNGPVTINVADQFPAVGTIPLISYVGPKGGGGSFVLGTLPNGVVATLNDNGTGLVSLNVTSADQDRRQDRRLDRHRRHRCERHRDRPTGARAWSSAGNHGFRHHRDDHHVEQRRHRHGNGRELPVRDHRRNQ